MKLYGKICWGIKRKRRRGSGRCMDRASAGSALSLTSASSMLFLNLESESADYDSPEGLKEGISSVYFPRNLQTDI